MAAKIMNRRSLLLLALVGLVLLGLVMGPKLLRLYRVFHLFDQDVIVENFLNMERVLPVSTIAPAKTPFIFPQGTAQVPPGPPYLSMT